MNWEQLLSTIRTGQENQTQIKHDRTQFQRDYDRLIFSSPFRRLQDKTQVFPLPGSIFVHNRLTHSLEVASVGRSLGNNIAARLTKAGHGNPELVAEIGSVVAAACLAHDLGNPPFGHSGEAAIGHYFTNGEGKKFKAELSPSQWTDITRFEGNANALRMLTHAFKGRRKGGFAMTYTTIASIIKYPYSSGVGLKKYGYFQSEYDTFEHIASTLGLQLLDSVKGIYARHPLVYLVEAADDICYQVMDIEDAHKLKILSYEETYDLLTGFFDKDQEAEEFKKIASVFEEVTDLNERMAFLRAKVIGKLVGQCTEIFWNNHANILNGTFEKGLIDHLSGHEREAMETCQTTAYTRIYKHPSVVEIEIAGYRILGTLLEEFIKAVTNPNDFYSKMLLPFIPEQFRCETDTPLYDKIQSVLDFISGMTDVYALDLYKKISGIGLK
ncbi:deoxyguanosinetriphosphate triphosphohydrolase [Carboxylicivirga sediminis]|uniref:Deoxyguanosinetriphosphate triphosphohydrolase n=1 Tax=Carboxylicivirga sediminis TaxID=2006564 RepID=A0A941F197_9BACT|nr:deoxyguanosinetriphosphate triphosphohydrolase [Carboxylicivirga sediminis]MBR8534996.1 deoxyguanosinetriphosphate triphosphohydrolase [Carboxylicivirga sediminis]